MAGQPHREPPSALPQLPLHDGQLPRTRQRAYRHMSDYMRYARTRPTSAELHAAVSGSVSIAEALRRLERPDNGTQRALLRRWIIEEGLSTAHFLGQAHQRGRPGVTPLRQPEDILVKHGGKRRTRTALLRRALRALGVPEKCVGCGTGPEWLGKPMTLEIDHVNGDWSDDRRENLQLLCPNCHASTDTWCRGGQRRTLPPQ
ncbi:HNH endonuclease [Streptomyces sp. NPDC048188]|uniref:HNH endonuclease n=1 Tax=Streptomyces sp. NPDC048188 TaxID=3155749 RepID=UPI0034265B16